MVNRKLVAKTNLAPKTLETRLVQVINGLVNVTANQMTPKTATETSERNKKKAKGKRHRKNTARILTQKLAGVGNSNSLVGQAKQIRTRRARRTTPT